MQFDASRRRGLSLLFGGAAAAWPLAAGAQQAGKIYRIGYLGNDPTTPSGPPGKAFVDALRENGFVDGKNILIDWRFAEGRIDRFTDLATALVKLQMDLIVAVSSQAVIAAKEATRSIPIVMIGVIDPVEFGIVASLASSGSNITGLTRDDSTEIAGKLLQLLKDAVPQAARIAVLLHPDDPVSLSQWRMLERAATVLNVSLLVVGVRQKEDFAAAFARLAGERPDALLVVNSALNFTNRKLIMEWAVGARLPAMSNYKESTEAGGLMSYGSNRLDSFRRAATYVGKILKGAKPSDLPIEQPITYELVINLKTAKVLGIEISRQLLLIADDVIE
jgi:putative ABC transport system substrate-binding protein